MATDADCTQRRLVMYRTDRGTEAALYPLDANAFTTPEWVFTLEAGQPLPNQPPGDPVTVEGRLAPKARPRVRAGDTEIRVPGGLRRHALRGDRIFAERGDVVAHPQAIGWDESWRHVISASTGSVAAWQRRVRAAIAGAGITWLLLLVYLATLLWRGDAGYGVRPLAYGLGGVGAALCAGAYALRARRALRRARRLVRGRAPAPMRMHLWWAAGGPQGPMAMAALFAPGTDEAVVHVPVVNVPPRLVTEEMLDVEVYGDPNETPVIRLDDTYLWPAQSSYA